MKEKKNIDRIFQEKFKDFEANPPEGMWDRIASELDKKDKKRPFIIPLWFKIAGVAAVLAIMVAGVLFTGNDIIDQEPGIVNRPDSTTPSSNTEEEKLKESGSQLSNSDEPGLKNTTPSEENNKKGINSREKSASAIAQQEAKPQAENSDKSVGKKGNFQTNKPLKRTDDNNAVAVNDKNSISEKKDKNVSEKEKLVDQPEVSDKAASGLIAANEEQKPADSITNKPENTLAEIEKEKEKSVEEIAESNSKHLSLSTFAAPLFYKNIGSGNELSSQLANNSSASEVTVSYGVKVAYEISDKIKIRTGISKINVSNTIQDIAYSPSALSMGIENISPAGDSFLIRSNSPSNSFASESTMNSLAAPLFTPGEIHQNFGFIEVPLEIEYALIDKKLGLNLIGGASTLFLDGNRVDLVSGTINTRLGEANNINSTSFSTNLGVGIDYDLNDKFSLNVEPIIKYQLNTFNNVNNVLPVNFGIYSGLTLKF